MSAEAPESRRSWGENNPNHGRSGGMRAWSSRPKADFVGTHTRPACVPEQAERSSEDAGTQEESRITGPFFRAASRSLALSRSTTIIGLPHCGQRHVDSRVGAAGGADEGGTASNCRQSATDSFRRRLERKPKLRMRTKRWGRMCWRKRRRNSCGSTVITRC
jgi:hypothetical protein